MPKLAGVNHLDAVRALERAGFRILRQGKHIVMTDGVRVITIPRHNPVNAFTMGGIIRDAGLTVAETNESPPLRALRVKPFPFDARDKLYPECNSSLRFTRRRLKSRSM